MLTNFLICSLQNQVIAFAVPIILGICLFLILRYRRRSRAIEEEGADFNPPLPGDKDASNYQQLHSPVSANGAAGFDSVAPLSYIGGGSKGGNGAPGARNQSRGLPEMQQKQMPGGANDSTDLAMDDMVQVTMLDDDEDEGVSSGPALQLPVMPKLQTTFSLGSNPSSVDEAEFESPETMVASTQSPSKDKDHAYTEAVARQLSVEPIMIAVADVRLGEEYLSSPIQHTIRKPYQFKQAAMEMEEKQPDSATTDVSASTGAYYTPTSEIAETPITATRAAPSTAGPVQQKSQRPPSPSRYRFDEERLPRMVNVMSIVSQPSEDSLSPVTAATSQPAPTSPAVAPVAPPATSLAPKPSIRSAKKAAPASGISDLLSLYAGMSEHGEEEEGEPYELETPTTAVSSATSLDKGKQVVRDYVPQDEEEDSIPEPDSPIPTNGVLARKGTTKTIHELENVATFRPRVARAFKAGIKSGAASVILSEEATTVPLDGTKAAVKQNGRFESFLGIIDGSGEQ